jgi:hypothetical protein
MANRFGYTERLFKTALERLEKKIEGGAYSGFFDSDKPGDIKARWEHTWSDTVEEVTEELYKKEMREHGTEPVAFALKYAYWHALTENPPFKVTTGRNGKANVEIEMRIPSSMELSKYFDEAKKKYLEEKQREKLEKPEKQKELEKPSELELEKHKKQRLYEEIGKSLGAPEPDKFSGNAEKYWEYLMEIIQVEQDVAKKVKDFREETTIETIIGYVSSAGLSNAKERAEELGIELEIRKPEKWIEKRKLKKELRKKMKEHGWKEAYMIELTGKKAALREYMGKVDKKQIELKK